MSGPLTQDDVVAGILHACCRVMAVLLSDGARVIAMDGAELAPFLRHDIGEVLKLRHLPPFRIARMAVWSPLMSEQASPRDRDALIALVLGIIQK